ncbi:MAG: hypothetical protein Q9198_003434 [Flavoplaca austrocitrina]
MATAKPEYLRGEIVIHPGNSSTSMTDGPIHYAPELQLSHIMAGYTDPWHTQLQILHQQSHPTHTPSPSLSSTSSTITSRQASHPSSLSNPHGPSAKTSSTYRSLLHSLTSFLSTSHSKRVYHRNLQHAILLAQTYFSSCSLSPRLANERDVYCFCRHLLQGDPMSSGALTHYIGVLEFRLRGLANATKYKNLLGPDNNFPACYGWNYGRWENEVLSPGSAFRSTTSTTVTRRSSRETTSSFSSSRATATGPTLSTHEHNYHTHRHQRKLLLKFEYCLELILQSNIFASPTEKEGPMDLKPIYYLAAAFASSGRSSRTIKGMVSTAVKTKSGVEEVNIKVVGTEIFATIRKKGEAEEEWEDFFLG